MKKLKLFLLLTLLALSLTGCGNKEGTLSDRIKAAFSNVTGTVVSDSLEAKLSGSTWSSGTLSKGKDYMQAVAEQKLVFNKTTDDYGWSLSGLFTGKGLTPGQQMRYERKQAQAKVNRTQSALEASMKGDDAVREDYKTKQDKENKSSFVWILLLIVAIVIVVLLLRKKAENEEVTAPPSDVERKDLRDIKMRDWDADGRKLCAKKGLNWEEELAKNNNDKVGTVKRLLG